jgi:hypothetical protein
MSRPPSPSARSDHGWKAIGAALAVGKAHALRVTGANAAWGRNYSHEFSQWLEHHGFKKTSSGFEMTPSVRSHVWPQSAISRSFSISSCEKRRSEATA